MDVARTTLTIILDINNTIAQELQIFHHLHPNAIDAIVPDSIMEPVFAKGDYVAGIRYFEQDMHKLIGKNCIVQLPTGELFIRTLKAGARQGLYTLSCFNFKAKNGASIRDVKLFSAASIIWTRKPE